MTLNDMSVWYDMSYWKFWMSLCHVSMTRHIDMSFIFFTSRDQSYQEQNVHISSLFKERLGNPEQFAILLSVTDSY